MNIGIIDADLIGAKNHRFPNLASMKISAYNKNHGNNVKLITSYDEDFNQYDDIYLSKVFTATEVPQSIIDLPNIHCGGTGFFYDKAPPLKDEIEHMKPDYHLYDDWISTLVERERERERGKFHFHNSNGIQIIVLVLQQEVVLENAHSA